MPFVYNDSILDQTVCVYCQKRHKTPRGLQQHVTHFHPGSDVDLALKQAYKLRAAMKRRERYERNGR